MRWNWQQAEWPKYRWKAEVMAKAEAVYLLGAGVLVGSAKHLDEDAQSNCL